MNFSIAYGKTVFGFMKDWKCSKEEAQNTVDMWYRDRPEVKKWQQQVQVIAQLKGYTKTLLGRYRNLEKHFADSKKMNIFEVFANKYDKHKEHGLRAAINTPIQGGAADIVVAAMIKLHYDKELKDLGYKLLLQIHDEVILVRFNYDLLIKGRA